MEDAAAYVGAALPEEVRASLLPSVIARHAHERWLGFLADPLESTPLGFWTGNQELARTFLQDRMLMQGIQVTRSQPRPGPTGGTALIWGLGARADLADAFRRFRAVDAVVTNPSWDEEVDLIAVLDRLHRRIEAEEGTGPHPVAALQAELDQALGPRASVALLSYAQSPEFAIMERWDPRSGEEGTMEDVIRAIRDGSLDLTPRPDSGWYDRQWYALETLLLPERAQESYKLVLTQRYRQRLENAFRSAITKTRETHIKHLPTFTIGSTLAGTPPPRVRIGPEFSAEPVATVYLRMARGTRFVHDALAATLDGLTEGMTGVDVLDAIPLLRTGAGSAEGRVGPELRRAARWLYGLYDILCDELGMPPAYLQDELTDEEILASRKEATDWLANWTEDPRLKDDTRVAVPAVRREDWTIVHWGTAGVTLEPVKYRYLEEPEVHGAEATFVSTRYVLPTDLFVAFTPEGRSPLTREAFRALCDAHPTAGALARGLGATLPPSGGWRIPSAWIWGVGAVLALVGLTAAVRRGSPRTRKFIRRTAWAGAAVALVWGGAMVALPGYRFRTLAKLVAGRQSGLEVMVMGRFYHPDHLTPALLTHRSPQVRYYVIWCTMNKYVEDRESWTHRPGMREALMELAKDPHDEIASWALLRLYDYPDDEVVDLLRRRLETAGGNATIRDAALSGLAGLRHPVAPRILLDYVDRHPGRIALRSFPFYLMLHTQDPVVVAFLLEQAEDEESPGSASAAAVLARALQYSKEEPTPELREAWTALADRPHLAFGNRHLLAQRLSDVPRQVAMLREMLQNPDSSGSHDSWGRGRIIYELGRLGPQAAEAVPDLHSLLDGPDLASDERRAARTALEAIVGERP